MSDADDKLDFCKQALGELGTRSTITAVDPPDGSPEAFYCNLFFASTRDQLLRAAHWSFAGRTDRAALWKALPGTPENPDASAGWSNRDPAPPWLYSYAHKNVAILQIRRVRGSTVDSAAPLFGGAASRAVDNRMSCAPFEIAVDAYDRARISLALTRTVSAITITSAGTGYLPGDYVTMEGDAASLMGQPITLHVLSVNVTGGVVTAGLTDGGTFASATAPTVTQTRTTGNGTGFACTAATTVVHSGEQKVILTNAQNIIIDYTTSSVLMAMYDPSFSDAFGLALQGKLALALIGDKQLATGKLQQANAAIIEARVRDGNEGLLVYDHVPDWLQVRGVASMTPTVPFNPPYGPLFGV